MLWWYRQALQALGHLELSHEVDAVVHNSEPASHTTLRMHMGFTRDIGGTHRIEAATWPVSLPEVDAQRITKIVWALFVVSMLSETW